MFEPLRVSLLPHFWLLKLLALGLLLFVAYAFAQTAYWGWETRRLRVFYPASLAEWRYRDHRRWRIILDVALAVTVIGVEGLLWVKGTRFEGELKSTHLACVAAFCVMFLLTHIFHGKSKRLGGFHKPFAWISCGLFWLVTITGLPLFWDL